MFNRFATRIEAIPITIVIIATACFMFAVFGDGVFTAAGGPLVDYALAYPNILRHGNPGHLLGNAIMLAIAGLMVEPRVRRRDYLVLIALSAVCATTLEFLMTDRPFVGLSGVALGIAVFALIGGATGPGLVLWGCLILAALSVDFWMMKEVLAVYAHAGGAAAGAGIVMFNKMFGQKGPKLIPMGPEHHAYVIAIIAETDEDDAEEAEAQFQEDGYDGMFVLAEGRQVLGVTGAHLAENSEDVVWLSWTYLSEDCQGEGMGQMMLDGLLGQLNEHGVRKIFIATSDYKEDGEEIYADAMAFYRSLGAEEEMRIPDYHDTGETKICYGLINPSIDPEPAPEIGVISGVQFGRLTPASESIGGFGVAWDLSGEGIHGLDVAIEQARRQNGRAVFVALPSDASEFATSELEAQGFTCYGHLKDYHAVGIDDVWWSKPLN